MNDAHHSPRAPSRDGASIRSQAADWFSREDRGFSATEAAEYAAWLSADPRHAAAVRQIAASARAVTAFQDNADADDVIVEIEAKVSARKRRTRLGLLSVGGVAAALTLVLFQLHPSREKAPTFNVASGTITVKPERRALPDGSWVELNAGAEIADSFDVSRRRVRLIRGTAYFSVAPDPSRPFVVEVGNVAVRALGTEFSVAMNPREVAVVVTNGKVAVQRTGPGTGTGTTVQDSGSPGTILSAGDWVFVPTDDATKSLKVETAPQEQLESSHAWRNRRVQFSEVPLRQIVDVYNRQNRIQLSVEGDEAASLQVNCIYWLDDPEGFARLIESSAGLKVHRASPSHLILRQR